MSICDASSSWSGYQYQGKITIYIALKLINKCVEKSKIIDINKYFIEVEYCEDLAIKKENEYISFHQVKARKSDVYMNNYLEAIDKLYQEKIKNPNAQIYLHTIVNIKDWSEEKYESLYTNKIDGVVKKIKELEEVNSKITDSRKLSVNEAKIEELKEIIKYNEEQKKQKNRIKDVILYEYGSNSETFCELGKIKGYIEQEISEYLKSTSQNQKLGDIEVVYNKLICYMDEYIKKRHAGNAKETFALKEIKDILDSPYLERGKEYHLSIIKDIYCSLTLESYCSDFCNKKEECTMELLSCKVYKVVEHLLNIDLSDLEKVIMKFNPHVLVNNWEHDRRHFIDEYGIYFLYMTIISHIEKNIFIDDAVIKYEKDGISYLPTTIKEVSSMFKKSTIEKYKKAINNNTFLLNELFEENIFITENLISGNLLDSINDVEEVDEILVDEQAKYHDKCYLINEIKFASVTEVMEEINND